MDERTLMRVALLIQESRRVFYAYHNKATDDCILLEHPAAIGGDPIAVVTLLKKEYEGGPLFGLELMPGTSEATGEKVKEICKDVLLCDGTIMLPGPVS